MSVLKEGGRRGAVCRGSVAICFSIGTVSAFFFLLSFFLSFKFYNSEKKMFGISVNFSRQRSLYKFVLFKKFQSYKTLFKILKIFIRIFFFFYSNDKVKQFL